MFEDKEYMFYHCQSSSQQTGFISDQVDEEYERCHLENLQTQQDIERRILETEFIGDSGSGSSSHNSLSQSLISVI